MIAAVISKGALCIKCMCVGIAILHIGTFETGVIGNYIMDHVIAIGPCNGGACFYSDATRTELHIVHANCIA